MQTNRLIIGSCSIVTALLVGVLVNERNSNQSTKAELSLLKQNLVTIQAENAARQAEYVDLLNRQRVELIGDIAKQHTELAVIFDDQRKILSTEVATSNNTFIQKSTSLQKEIDKQRDELRVSIQQQTSVVHRALGKVIPIELPEGLNTQIENIERIVRLPSSWPKTQEEFQVLHNQLGAFLKQLPPWAEENFLPRINEVRWNLNAISALMISRNAKGDELADIRERLDGVVATASSITDKSLIDQLVRQRNSVISQYQKYLKDSAIEAANAELHKDLPPESSSKQLKDAYSQLSDYRSDSAVVVLLKMIRERIVFLEINQFVRVSRGTLTKVKDAKSENLKQAALVNAYEGATNQRLLLLGDPDATHYSVNAITVYCDELEDQVKALEKKATASQAERIRDYQRWALSQIQQFRGAYDSAKNRKKTVPGLAWGTNRVDDRDWDGMKNAMITWLLPISASQLEPAVAQLYNEAFGSAMRDLEDRKFLQTSVASAEAIVVKRKP